MKCCVETNIWAINTTVNQSSQYKLAAPIGTIQGHCEICKSGLKIKQFICEWVAVMTRVLVMWNFDGVGNRWRFTVWRGFLCVVNWSVLQERFPHVSQSNLALAFFFTTPFWIHETFTSSLSNPAYISGLNLVITTYKKQKLQTIIHLVKRKKTTYGAACSLFCIHITLASSINWQVHLYSSYNEGQRGTSMHQLQNICMVFSNPGSQFPPLRSYTSLRV